MDVEFSDTIIWHLNLKGHNRVIGNAIWSAIASVIGDCNELPGWSKAYLKSRAETKDSSAFAVEAIVNQC